jgi:hypothetical protein
MIGWIFCYPPAPHAPLIAFGQKERHGALTTIAFATGAPLLSKKTQNKLHANLQASLYPDTADALLTDQDSPSDKTLVRAHHLYVTGNPPNHPFPHSMSYL